MHRPHPLRPQVLLAAGLLAAIFATASTTRTLAQSLPPMQPTSQMPPTQPPGAPTASLPPANPAHHAEITFTNGQLQVRADNSSLNQILRSISHQTGLKITGGVEDQRVFGNYGPGPISSILATLLDGTGTNVLLLGGGANTPHELQLTPRNGGASPPGPNSEAYAMYDDSIDKQAPVPPPPSPSPTASTQPETHGLAGPPAAPQPLIAPSVGASHPAPAAAVLPAPPPHSVPTPAAGTPSSASTTPKHLTPEMVMQELLKIQAQKQEQKKLLQQQLDQQKSAQQQKLLKTNPSSSQPPASSTPPQ